MKKKCLTPREMQQLKQRYGKLASQLGSFESLSQGSVMPQPPNAWRWTRKVRGKTVTRGLPTEKAQEMKRAIANHRAMDKIIDEMREITQILILESQEITNFSDQEKHPKPALS